MIVDMNALGWDSGFAAGYRPYDRSDAQPGRVARVDRGVCTVLCTGGPVRASIGGALLALAARDPVALPCTGDWVVLRRWPDRRTTLEYVLARRTAVVRAVAGRRAQGQVLAANLDTAAVVEPMEPAPDPARIQRLLSLAWASGARPVLLLTKADLVPDPVAVAAHAAAAAPGVPVLTVAARTGTGLAAVRALAGPGATLGLLGPSGCGKSTLVNALAGATVMDVRSRRADGKGRHTTTYRALVPLPGGGAVLDTPGVREVGLHAAATGLARVFADIEALAARCRFTDCGHGTEPGCAVQAALAAGDLAPRRYESWRKLGREQDWYARRRDSRLAAQARQEWRSRQEAARSSPRR